MKRVLSAGLFFDTYVLKKLTIMTKNPIILKRTSGDRYNMNTQIERLKNFMRALLEIL